MSTIRFALYKGPQDSLLHLVLLVRQRPLMHWVVPATTGRSASGLLEKGLLLEAPAALTLPNLIAQGTCELAYEGAASTCGSLQAALDKGSVLLTFSGRHVQGTYSLIRLHETSTAWLLSPVTYLSGKRQVASSGKTSAINPVNTISSQAA